VLQISFCSISPLVYRLGYGPFKAEGGVRFPDGEAYFVMPIPNIISVHIISRNTKTEPEKTEQVEVEKEGEAQLRR